MTERKFAKRPWSAPRLTVSGGLRLVFRREVKLAANPGPRIEAAAQAVLQDAGFEPVRTTHPPGGGGDSPSPDPDGWLGERWLPRRRGTASTTRTPIITVLLGGGILGGVDAYIANSPLVFGYWLLGASVIALLFWARYGRTYDTDVAMVTFSRTSSNGAAETGSPSVVFWAARLRSQVYSGIRVPAGVSGPIWLAAEIGAIGQEFERRLAQAGEQTVPPVGPP